MQRGGKASGKRGWIIVFGGKNALIPAPTPERSFSGGRTAMAALRLTLFGGFEARGAGSNTIFISPDHDLVIVWRWHGAGKEDFFRQVIASIQGTTSAGVR